MGVMLGLVIAGAVTQAAPLGRSNVWLTDRDYPAGAKKRHEEGPVAFSILISPQGRVEHCLVTKSSSFHELDERTCALISARARFKPATDETGTAVYGNYQGSLYWWDPKRKGIPVFKNNFAPPSDMEIQVRILPNGAYKESITVITKIEPSGHIVSCEPFLPTKSSPKLSEVACTEAKANYQFIQANGEGKPVTVVRNLRITFTAAASN